MEWLGIPLLGIIDNLVLLEVISSGLIMLMQLDIIEIVYVHAIIIASLAY